MAYPGNPKQLLDHIKSILGSEDLLLVVEAKEAAWTKLLRDTESLKQLDDVEFYLSGLPRILKRVIIEFKPEWARLRRQVQELRPPHPNG